MQSRLLLLLSICFLFSAKSNSQNTSKNKIDLKRIVAESPVAIDISANKLQIIVGEIQKSKSSKIDITYTKLGVQSEGYFYPASCVKLPLVILALEWLNEHRDANITISSPFELVSGVNCHSFKSIGDSYDDILTIENCIKKILLVSDNRSYNALFDLLGRDYINSKLKEKGYTKTQIVKSFSGCHDSLLNFKPALNFLNDKHEIIFHLDSLNYVNPISKLPIDAKVGDSIMIDSITTLSGAKDFSFNNYLPLEEGIDMLIQLIYPSEKPKWEITAKQRQFLMYWMSRYPRESKIKIYTSGKQYFDAYKKYLFYGRGEKPIKSDSLRIYNIVGLSYGFATDIAYVKSKSGRKEYFIAATTYSNVDGVMNDNKYDYETIGFPFLKYLGRQIYNQRK
jgi:hypothetical protein